jgi:Family of unknown function (DUF5317)
VLRALFVLAVIALALLRGGTLRNFATVELRALPLVFGGLALQVLIFTPFLAQPLISFATPVLYLASMALLVAWAWQNRSLPGLGIAMLGVVLNTAAIAANGGYMPVDPMAATYAGQLVDYATTGPAINNNSVATSEGVRLWLFTDIFPVPAAIPLATVYSLGDFLLTAGASIFCYTVSVGAGPARAGLLPTTQETQP